MHAGRLPHQEFAEEFRATWRGSRPKEARLSGRNQDLELVGRSLSRWIVVDRTIRGGLDRPGQRVAGGGHVRRGVIERLAWLIGELFVLRAYLTNRIVPAIVPTDASFPTADIARIEFESS